MFAETAYAATAVTANDPAAAFAIGSLLGGTVVFTLIFYILLVIAYWKMFTKCGEAGWKSIIPFYNMYIAFKLAWKDGAKNYWIFLAAYILTVVFSTLGGVDPYTGTIAANGSIVFQALAMVAGIVTLVWAIRFVLKQAKSFGKGLGTGILAIIFPSILTLYFGFSKCKYVGPQD